MQGDDTTASMPHKDQALGLKRRGLQDHQYAEPHEHLLHVFQWSDLGFGRPLRDVDEDSGFPAFPADPNSAEETWGRYNAVDPANAEVAFVSTPSNGGCLFHRQRRRQLVTNPSSTPSRMQRGQRGKAAATSSALIPTSAVVDGVTHSVCASSYGVEHLSLDGWRQNLRPRFHLHRRRCGRMDRQPDPGVVWLVDDPGGSLRRLEIRRKWTQTGEPTEG